MNTELEVHESRTDDAVAPAQGRRGRRPAQTTGRRPAQTTGRPRNDDRTAAILDATAELLMEIGYDRLRIQDVADRAGAGTGAIYRRWSTKEALVADAIRSMPDPAVDRTDDPVADLRALIERKFAAAAANPGLYTGMMAAIRTEPVIAEAVRDRFTVDLLRREVARVLGDDNPHLDVLAELVPGLIAHRSAFSGEPVDLDALIDQFVALVETARH